MPGQVLVLSRLVGRSSYEYDKNGNRTKIGGSFARTGLPQSITSTAYNAANHQTTFGDKTLTYDNNGNLQTITDGSGTTTYTWNARNQLVAISGPGISASFLYDGLGRRESKTVNGNLTEFLYDGRNPVQETSGAAVLANVLPGLRIDEFLTRTDVVSGIPSYFLTDALGSPVAVTDNAGAVQTEYTYEPFGKTTVSGASNTNSYQYTGRENDGTGLYYYRARFYHPQLQRFISEDPIGFSGGDFNLFPYVGNDPLLFVDPFGFDKCKKLKCDPEPPPCKTMDCEPKPPPPEPPCKTPGECFGPGPTPPPTPTPANPGDNFNPQSPSPDRDWEDLVDNTCDFVSAVCQVLGVDKASCEALNGMCRFYGKNPDLEKRRR